MRKALDILFTGVRRMLGRPGLVALLFCGSLLISLSASVPLLFCLKGALDERPLGRALAQGRADVLFGELATDQPGLLRVLLPSLVMAVLLSWLFSTLLSGGLVQALRRPGDPQRVLGPAVLAQAARHAGRMLRLALHGLLLRLPILVLGALFGAAFYKLAPGRPYARVFPLAGAALLVLGFLWSVASVAQHYAQLYRLDMPARRRWASYHALRRGLCHAIGAGLCSTLLLAAVSLVFVLTLLFSGRLMAHRLDLALAVGPAVLVRQLCALCRAALSVAVLAGSIESVESLDAHPEASG